MRPETTPAGSRITASLTESQTSSSPRRIWISHDLGRGLVRLQAPLQNVCGTSAHRLDAGTSVISSAAEFHRTTLPSRSTATMPSATLPRIAKLRSRSSTTRWRELGVREERRDVSGERRESLHLLLAPCSPVRTRRARRGRLLPGRAAAHRDTRRPPASSSASEPLTSLSARASPTATGPRDWTTSPASARPARPCCRSPSRPPPRARR